MQKVNSLEDFQSSLDINTKVSVSYGFFNASANFEFAEKQHFHSYSEYLIAKVTVENPLRMIHDVILTDSAKNLLQNGQSTRFHEQFGDFFVQGIKTGGSYYVVLEFTSRSSEEQRNISAKLDAGVVGTFSGSATFSESIKKLTEGSSLKVTSFQLGGKDTTQPITIEEIIKKASKFPLDVIDNAVPIQAFIQDYKILDLPPEPNFVNIENAKLALQQFYRLRNTFVNKLNDIEFILDHSDQFEDFDSDKLTDAVGKIQKFLDGLTQRASDCVNNIQQCKFETPEIPVIGVLPKRKLVSENATLRELLNRIKITSLKRFNGEDRICSPQFITTQPSLEGKPAWQIYHYLWIENPLHFDVEAIVGIIESPNPNGHIVEIAKLSGLAIKIQIDANEFIIPTSASGQVQPGFFSTFVPK